MYWERAQLYMVIKWQKRRPESFPLGALMLQLKRKNLPFVDLQPHFSPLNDLPRPWNPSRLTGRTQKCCARHQEHQNRTNVAQISPRNVKIALLLGKDKMGQKGLKQATAVLFWCSWYPTQLFWVRPVALDGFQGPGRSFSGEKWGWKVFHSGPCYHTMTGKISHFLISVLIFHL